MKRDNSRQWRGEMIIRKGRRKAVMSVVLSIVVIGGMIMLGQESTDLEDNLWNRHRSLRNLLTAYASVRNSNRVKMWRDRATEMCKSAALHEDEIEPAREMALQAFSYKNNEEIDVMDRVVERSSSMTAASATARTTTTTNDEEEAVENNVINEDFYDDHDKVVRCPFVLLDLGSGVGDSVGEFIDAGSVSCPIRSGGDKESWEEPHFDVDSGLVSFRSQKTTTIRKSESDEEFVAWARDRLAHFSESIGPEDYCVYGVEGSPVLKPDLLKLQRHIRKMDPRPLRHLHFFTETLALDSSNQRKTLYLDTTYGQDRFPGSSVFSTHQSIVTSQLRDSELMDFSATTISLSQLMIDTLSYYNTPTPTDQQSTSSTTAADTSNSDVQQKQLETGISNTAPPDLTIMEKNSRNHLLLNIDIEGSEYHVLNEVKDSGMLCDFAKAGNQVDIFIQYHDPQTVGVESSNAKRWVKEVRPYFRRNCGDNISFYERQRYFMPPSPPKILTNAVV